MYWNYARAKKPALFFPLFVFFFQVLCFFLLPTMLHGRVPASFHRGCIHFVPAMQTAQSPKSIRHRPHPGSKVHRTFALQRLKDFLNNEIFNCDDNLLRRTGLIKKALRKFLWAVAGKRNRCCKSNFEKSRNSRCNQPPKSNAGTGLFLCAGAKNF